jgi:acid phosphatase (class A)
MRHTPALFTSGALAALTLFFFDAAAQGPRKPVYITPDQLNMADILPDPPVDGSPEAKAELAEVHRLQDSRDAVLIAHVRADDAEEDIFIFKDVLGGKFNAAALPLTALLSAHLHNDESVIVNPAKEHFRKLRPFNFDPTVKPVCKTNANVKDYGYPSGHGTTGYLEAIALVQMVPEKRGAIFARADDYAHSREVCGVHYPADEAAARTTAYAMMAIVMNNPVFRGEFDAAKAETRKALGF